MRLIIREYLQQLKEDQELDLLVGEILYAMDIQVISQPEGGREYGVDLSGVGIDPEDGKKKMFLMVVKRGKINRHKWNNGPQSVRQSIGDIKDTYLYHHIPQAYKKLPKKIIVVTNDYFDPKLNLNWEGTERDMAKSHSDTKLLRWDLENLAHKIENYLLDEGLFPAELRTQMRKALSLLDLPDYDFRHYYELIRKVLENIPPKEKRGAKRIRLKSLKMLLLAQQVLFQWAQSEGKIKPALITCERLILLLWGWICYNNLLEDKAVIKVFEDLCILKLKIEWVYFDSVKEHYSTVDGLAQYRTWGLEVEFPLLVYEEVGLLSTSILHRIGLLKRYSTIKKTQRSEELLSFIQSVEKEIEILGDYLVVLISHQSGIKYIHLDDQNGELCLVFLALFHINKKEKISALIRKILQYMVVRYKKDKFFPLYYKDYDTLVEVISGRKNTGIDGSFVLTLLLEWAVILEDEVLYKEIKSSIQDVFPGVNLQLWFPLPDLEKSIITNDPFKIKGKLLVNIKVPAELESYLEDMLQGLDQINERDSFLFFEFNREELGLMASRHFGFSVFPFYWRRFLIQE